MLNTRDEILFKFAAELPGPPAPEPPSDIEELRPVFPKPLEPEIEEEGEIKTEVTELPISVPHPMENFADRNEKAFLTDTQTDYKGYKGYVRVPELQPIVERKMDEIVRDRPWVYFEWKLYSPHRHGGALQGWLYDATLSFLKKDPVRVIENRIFDVTGTEDFYTEMWQEAWNVKKGERPLSQRDIFFRQMRRLSSKIAEHDTEFYHLNIEESPFATLQDIRKQRKRERDKNIFLK